MKQGRSLMDLVSELERQRNMRKDYIADTRNLEISTDECISTLTMFLDNTTESFKINETTHHQISSRLQIPYKYYQKMRAEYPTLLDENINCWLNKSDRASPPITVGPRTEDVKLKISRTLKGHSFSAEARQKNERC